MVALKAHEVGRFIDRPDIEHGIFLAYGPDAGLVRETGQRLARRFAGSDADSMNLIVLDGAELDVDPSRLAIEARTTSLFGDRRVIRITESEVTMQGNAGLQTLKLFPGIEKRYPAGTSGPAVAQPKKAHIK